MLLERLVGAYSDMEIAGVLRETIEDKVIIFNMTS